MSNIRHEVIIGATAESVYQAITRPEGLSAWWTPGTSAKPELGSISRFPFGVTYYKAMEITRLIPFELVAWKCVHGAEEWIGTTIEFRLCSGDRDSLLNAYPEATGQIEQLSTDAGTLLVFEHDHWKTYTPMFAECNYTWGQFLRSLKLFCETGEGRPWPQQHRI